MRIAIAGITQESLVFSPIPTRLSEFKVLRGDEVLSYPHLADTLRPYDIEPVPLVTATHTAPSGAVEEATYLQLRHETIDRLKQAGPVDGVLLLMHGAMVVENLWSGETDMVREVRAVVGPEPLIAVRLDPHCNLTEEFASKADVWTAFRTAPHRDQKETLERTVALLVKALQSGKRPRPVFVRIPMLLQGEKSTTAIDPMKSLLQMAAAVEAEPGILNADVMIGFGWADAPHTGANIVVNALGEEHLPAARAHALRLAQTMWDRRDEFTFDQEIANTVDEAIDMALAGSASSTFITDSGDNPTAGAPGDNPHFLRTLLARNVPDAVFASMVDGDATRACFAAGVGATVNLSIGAKLDQAHGAPVETTGVVEHLHTPLPNAEYRDVPMATVRVGGVRIIVTERRKYFLNLEDFARANIDPLQHQIVVIKLGYLMPQLRDAAPREIMALSPGYADMELTRLPYRYVIRPAWPLDTDFAWRPQITNIAGWQD